MSFLGSYTWSHALTNTGTPLEGGPGIRDITNLRDNYSHARFHIKHRLSFSGLFEVPFGRGKRFGANMNQVANAILGDWQVNSILTLQTGNAFSLGTRRASCGCGGAVRPDLVSGKNPNDAPSGGRSPDMWFDITAVTDPARGTTGNLGHFSNYGPGYNNLDFSVFKSFPVAGEGQRIQFRAEFFNMFNTPHFTTPNGTQGDSNFGRIFNTLGLSERRIQLALRFEF